MKTMKVAVSAVALMLAADFAWAGWCVICTSQSSCGGPVTPWTFCGSEDFTIPQKCRRWEKRPELCQYPVVGVREYRYTDYVGYSCLSGQDCL